MPAEEEKSLYIEKGKKQMWKYTAKNKGNNTTGKYLRSATVGFIVFAIPPGLLVFFLYAR